MKLADTSEAKIGSTTNRYTTFRTLCAADA